jgi:site-specific recombinase XerD
VRRLGDTELGAFSGNPESEESRQVKGAWSRVRYAANRAQVPTGVHILRHTYCSHLVMNGAAMRAVQELVGHQDLTMTQRYSHLNPAALVDTVRLLESRGAVLGLEQ